MTRFLTPERKLEIIGKILSTPERDLEREKAYEAAPVNAVAPDPKQTLRYTIAIDGMVTRLDDPGQDGATFFLTEPEARLAAIKFNHLLCLIKAEKNRRKALKGLGA